MYNSKFIIHNNAKSFNDFEVFTFITSILEKGLISNNRTEYCYCTVREHEKVELVCTFIKNKNNYRIDIYEQGKNK